MTIDQPLAIGRQPLACIQLRGVSVHNLKHIDLDLSHGRLIVVCGVSGAGKSSLAIDTLYAEGQRRYIESFSAHTRQFLERLEKPQAERIDGLPPAIAVTNVDPSRAGNRATVGTATETAEYLRLLYARIGELSCPNCGQPIRRDSPQSIADTVSTLPADTRFLIAFPLAAAETESGTEKIDALTSRGYVRLLLNNRLFNLADATDLATVGDQLGAADALVVVDRLVAGHVSVPRLVESLETALREGNGRCTVLTERAAGFIPAVHHERIINSATWSECSFTTSLECLTCGITYPAPEPNLFSFESALGACPTCEGFGNIMEVDLDLVVPDRSKTLRDGAIAPWTTKSYAHELDELLALADDYNLPVDVPLKDLDERQWRIIREGVPERKFGGLTGFFAWLERHKYKVAVRAINRRYRSSRTCPDCGGTRLRREALAVHVGGRNIAELSAMKISDALQFVRDLTLDARRAAGFTPAVARTMFDQIQSRLEYLEAVGLGYLTLDRSIKSLSGGEAQRVSLTAALGSSLVHMLYVLDEPTRGLHPHDVQRLLAAIKRLRDRGNTVVVVEHEEAILRAADELVEIGPGAGDRGGTIVFQGPPGRIEAAAGSVTGDFLARRRGATIPAQRRPPTRGAIRLTGARGHNLQNLAVEFPLALLCAVSGVSGSGKSTLVEDTLYPALCRRLRIESQRPLPYDDVFGDGQINDVILVDQSPVGRSPRSNPVTYAKAFDDIRAVFADTTDAHTRGLTAGHFSFNIDGGRCTHCQGDGFLQIDMQFLPDVFMRCPECRGQRYRPEVLAVKYRGKSIAEVLDMTVREAFTFFRGQSKVQLRLKQLIDVGLDYLRLGQPANTLSGGEAQRLKLAAHLAASKRNRTLFILDEPTTGLHPADVAQLLDCFTSLLDAGHSLIVVEHNLQVLKAADFIIDLGPGAADQGGQIVATGPPEQIAASLQSQTAKYLRPALAGAH
jgi:excinuclease ABC subunit A